MSPLFNRGLIAANCVRNFDKTNPPSSYRWVQVDKILLFGIGLVRLSCEGPITCPMMIRFVYLKPCPFLPEQGVERYESMLR